MSYLDHLANAVFTQLELVSTTTAANLDSDKIRGSKAGSSRPTPVDAPHLHFRRRYAACYRDEHRRVVIGDALEELHKLRHAPKRVNSGTMEGRLEIGTSPHAAAVVAQIFGVSVRHVRYCRAEAVQHGLCVTDARKSAA